MKNNSLTKIVLPIALAGSLLGLAGSLVRGCSGDKEIKRPEPVQRDSAIVYFRNIGQSQIRDLDNDGQADVIIGDNESQIAKYVFPGYEDKVRTLPNYTKKMYPVMRTNASDVLACLGRLEDNINYNVYLEQIKIKGATQ